MQRVYNNIPEWKPFGKIVCSSERYSCQFKKSCKQAYPLDTSWPHNFDDLRHFNCINTTWYNIGSSGIYYDAHLVYRGRIYKNNSGSATHKTKCL